MNKAAIILGIATVAFAALTAHYGRQLVIERALNAASHVRPAAAATDPRLDATASVPSTPDNPAGPDNLAGPEHLAGSDKSGLSQTLAAPGAAPNTARPQAPATAPVHGARDPRLLAREADFLARLADPAQKSALLEEATAAARARLRGLESSLGSDPERWRRLLETAGAQQLEARENFARCLTNPQCASPEPGEFVQERWKQEIVDVIGAADADKLQAYSRSLMERSEVQEMQMRLGSGSLAANHAEELIAALANERDATIRSLYGDIGNVSAFSSRGGGQLFVPAGDLTTGQRIDFAQQYSQRLRDRATMLLSSDQMKTFNQMQDELLAAYRRSLGN